MKKLRFLLWVQLLVLPLIVLSSFSGCEKEEEDVVIPDVTGVMSYYRIPSNELNGWDEGFCYANESGTVCPYYIVSSTDSVNGDITVCLNETSNTDVEKSLVFHFSKSGDILKISMPGYYLDAEPDAENVDFVVYNEKGDALGVFSVPYIKDATRAGEFNFTNTIDWGKFMGGAADLVGNVWNFAEGNYGGVVSDLLLGKITGPIKRFDIRVLVAAGIKKHLELLYQRDQNIFMGSAEIKIVSVKRSSSTSVIVEGEILNRASIPSYRVRVADGLVGYTDNKVCYGIAVGKNQYAGYYLNENLVGPELVNKDKFSFTFHMEETPGEVYYFRPFLIPDFKIKKEDELFPDPYTCIRYGEAKKFMDMDVELENFKRTKCVKNGGKYNVQFTIDGKIPGVFDDLANWGFDVKSKSGAFERRYLANESGSYSVPTEKTFTCDVEISGSDIETVAGEQLAELTITPFILFRNSLPLMEFFEEKTFILTISDSFCPDDNHPHAIDLGLPSGTKWACCNVGASDPEGYGSYYAWGETEEKSDYTDLTYKYYLGDLDGDGREYDSNEDEIIGFNISGTQYDVARVKWSESWRMPTKDEVLELRDRCTNKWSTFNGVRGNLVIGPNGNRIFLPAAGKRVGTKIGSVGKGGNYWSASSYVGSNYVTGMFDFYSHYNTVYRLRWYETACYRCNGHTVRPVTE